MSDELDLGDFLGHLLSEITRARVQSDMESIRVAEVYASHPLLKHFPIPRVRLPDVELTLPVILSELPRIDMNDDEEDDQKKMAERSRVSDPVIDETHLNLAVNTALRSELPRLKLPPLLYKTFFNKLRLKLKTIAARQPRLSEATKLSREATDLVISFLSQETNPLNRGRVSSSAVRSLKQSLPNRILQELEKRPATTPMRAGVKITPQTGRVKDVGNKEYLSHFKLKITEEALEWSLAQTENEDEPEEILIPE